MARPSAAAGGAAVKLTNRTGLPQPLYAALLADDYDAGASDITATQLISPPRMVALERQHADDMEQDVAEMARLLIGKSVHAYIARVATGEFDDKRRLSIMVNDWLVSGQTDHVFANPDGSQELLTQVNHAIRDYKTMGVGEWMRGLRVEREQQLNIYAELLRANGYAVSGLGATCIFVDWNPKQARLRKDDYPPSSIVDVPVELWPQAQAQAFILDRVLAHQAARAELPLCSDEERWARGGQWAVMRAGAKRATKLFDDESEAYALAATIEGAYVESRDKEYARCEDYCRVASWCIQWGGSRGNAEL